MIAHVVVVSDRAYRGVRPDETAPRLRALLEDAGFRMTGPPATILPDERDRIAARLRELVADPAVRFVVTTGGTGAAPRDVTPEATRDVIEREFPGIGELMRAESLKTTIHAAGSRAVAGCAGTTLVVNLPGSPSGAVECLGAVLRPCLHILRLLEGAPADCAPDSGAVRNPGNRAATRPPPD